MLVVQIAIQNDWLPVSDLKNSSPTVLYISYFTTCMSIIFVGIDIALQAKALDESMVVFCLNCLQARQGWIPFLH
jgi:hypothetical protein